MYLSDRRERRRGSPRPHLDAGAGRRCAIRLRAGRSGAGPARGQRHVRGAGVSGRAAGVRLPAARRLGRAALRARQHGLAPPRRRLLRPDRAGGRGDCGGLLQHRRRLVRGRHFDRRKWSALVDAQHFRGQRGTGRQQPDLALCGGPRFLVRARFRSTR